MGCYRSSLFPENKEYLLISHDSAKRFLINLDGLDNETAYERLRMSLEGELA
jgi:hypothetical protein